MALSERSRNRIYTEFVPLIGPEASEEMLAYFPARDVEEPVTKEFLRAEISGLHAELANLRAELFGEMDAFRGELRGEMAALRTEIRGEMDTFKTEIRGEIGAFKTEIRGEMDAFKTEIRGEIGAFKTEIRGEIGELRHELKVQFRWLVGLMVSMIGIYASLLVALH